MPDNSTVKQYFKDCSDEEARRMYEWATTAMEVRGLITLPGQRKRRSDAGKPRTETPAEGEQLQLKENA